MAERLRALLEHPLDPRVSRAAVGLACIVMVGFALVAALGLAAGGDLSAPVPARSVPVGAAPHQNPVPADPAAPAHSFRRDRRPRRQDPQDEPGSPAAARAEQELADHRALQHVPFRRGGLTIALVGAKGKRAVLRISAPTLAIGRRGWRAFLRRYRDAGRSYLPYFKARGDRRAQRVGER